MNNMVGEGILRGSRESEANSVWLIADGGEQELIANANSI
jgi:hypothetical protein